MAWGAVLAAMASTAGLLVSINGATAQVTTPTAGTVIRDAGPVTIHEDTGGRYANGTASTLCTGANANTSPKASGRIEVIRVSDNTTVVDVTHFTSNNLNVNTANATGPFDAVWDTTGAAAGVYRIRSTAVNVSRAGLFSPCVGTAVTLSDYTVEYRPWRYNFSDILGTGNVGLNTSPREVQWSVKGNKSPVVDDAKAVKLFGAPDLAELALASDPQGCIDDPASCLPATAVPCSGACPDARFAFVNSHDPVGLNDLTGLFDLDSGAFVALARAQGHTRLLLSLGRDADAAVTGLFGTLIVGLTNGTGIDFADVLATVVKVRVGERDGNQTEFDISLGELLTIIYHAPKAADGSGKPNGISLIAPFSLGIGQVMHTYSYSLPVAQCATPHAGYTTTESQLVPATPPLIVPLPPPLLVVEPGGTLKHVEGDYPAGAGSHSVGNTALGPEIDTAPGSRSGLPVMLPFIDSGTVQDSDIDFVGHAIVVSIPEIRINPIPVLLPDGLCIGFGLLLGTGVALYGDNPLPVGFGALPLLWDEQNPAVLELIDAINGLSGDSLSNPAVQQVLGTVLGLLGGGAPDVDGIVGLLSDAGTLQSLLDTVAAGGLDAVPGLGEALGNLTEAIGGTAVVSQLVGLITGLLPV